MFLYYIHDTRVLPPRNAYALSLLDGSNWIFPVRGESTPMPLK